MKKSFLLILCLLLTIALVACANNDNKENEDTTSANATTAEATTAGGEETSADVTTEVTTVEGTSVEETSSEEESTTAEETTTGLVQTHEHTFSDEWTANDDGHWHAASCEHVGETSDFGAHVDADEDDECDVCEYDLSCDHPLSSDLEGIAAGHYHVTDCEHDLILDLTAHTGTDDGVCDACGFSFDDLIDEITAPEASNRVNGGTMTYKGQYENRTASFQLGFGVLLIDESLEYSYEEGVVYNKKHSIHLFNNDNVFYLIEENEMVSREAWNISKENIKGYKYSSDMYDYLPLDTEPCGTEDLLYAFYNFAKTNCANNLTVTWGETNNITFKMGDDFSAKVFSIDFTISENGVITSLNLSMDKYYGPDLDDLGQPVPETVKYTIDENGVITVVDGAVIDSTITIEIAQTEGSRENIKSSYNLDEIILQSYDIKLNDQVVTDSFNVEVGANVVLTLDGINPSTANLDLDSFNIIALDETGEETYNVNAFTMGNELYISVYRAGNYVLKLTTLATDKTIAVVATNPATTEIYAAVDDGWGNKEPITSKDVYAGAAFEFVGLAQNSYADATFTAVITEGPAGATLTELETADGYTFTATEAGTYVITITSKVDPAITNTLTLNVTAAPSVGENFKGVWENTTYGIVVEINPTDATSGTYTITMNNAPAQYSYTLNGTTIDAVNIAGVDQGWVLQFDSGLGLEIASPFGMAFPLTQTSTGDDTPSGATFSGIYTGDLDVMGMPMPAKVVVSGDSFTFELDGTTTTYYYSIDAATGYLTTIVGGGNPPAEFTFRYITDMNLLTVEMVHPMTGMSTEIGALANAGGSEVEPANKMDGKYKGILNMGVELAIEIEVDSMFETMTTVVDGISTTYAYSIGEDGILTTICVGGEQIGDFQFQYVAADDVIVINSFNPRLGYYAYAGDALKVTEEEPAAPSVEGMWTSADGVYTFTFWESDGDGSVDFADENGEWEKTRGFYFTMDDNGNITFTSIKGNLAGYRDWSTSSTAQVTDEGIVLVLDTGAVVLLTPKVW